MRAIPRWCFAILLAAPVGWFAVQLPGRNLRLRASAIAPGEFRISWDRRSVPALRAVGAVLEIDDGGSSYRRPLSAELLRESSFSYALRSDAAQVRLRVWESDGRPVEETVRFQGVPAAETLRAAVARAPKPAGRLRNVSAKRKPSGKIAEARTNTADRLATAQDAGPRTAELRPFVMAQLPGNARAASPAPALAAPPEMTVLPQLPFAHLLRPDLPKPRVVEGPRAGRLIWTGVLGRRGVVEIVGGRPSVGELSGALPGRPVSLRVQPAEFAAGGLVVYTSDIGARGRVERASPANGWNATRFEWDPTRAHQIFVLEAPNASNAFDRLALRSDARRCTVIVVDWSAP